MGSVESRENIAEFWCMVGNHASRIVVVVKAFQTFVTDRANYPVP